MSTEESRRVAHEWVKAMVECRIDDIKALAAPDATHFFSGLTSKVPMAGTASYESRIDGFARFRKSLKTFDVVIKDVIAEGNKVVLEIEPTATSAEHERVYKNNVLVKLVIEGGKVREVREYQDFFALFEFLGMKPQ